VEALIRWPQEGRRRGIEPGEFIPVAEQARPDPA
jgi:sensor c-di-GMP phosphodiesterase-like protein